MNSAAGDPKPGHVVLVGMMGTGKTTVGQALAVRLGRPFIDSDAAIEARTGHTVRELFESGGEAAFRSLETDALTEALAGSRPAVVAAAGGVVMAPENRRLLRQAAAVGGLVAWLHAPVAVLAGRVSTDDHRPLLGDDALAALTRLSADREPHYAEVADLELDADRPVGELVDELVAAVGGDRAGTS